MVVKNASQYSTQSFYPLGAFHTLWQTSHSVEKIHRSMTQRFFELSSQTISPKRSFSVSYLTYSQKEYKTTSLFIRYSRGSSSTPLPLIGRIDTFNYVY